MLCHVLYYAALVQYNHPGLWTGSVPLHFPTVPSRLATTGQYVIEKSFDRSRDVIISTFPEYRSVQDNNEGAIFGV